MRKYFGIKLIFALILAWAAAPALAYVMSSTSYRIERDTIDMGGGLSTSTSYTSESTIGGLGMGVGTSTSYSLSAGYLLMASSSVSLTIPGTTAMTPSIDGSIGGTANASASVTVITSNATGYTLQIKASTSPALKSGSNSFANYTLAGSDPDYDWSVGASVSEFGFTPEGTDIATRYKDSGGVCNQAAGSDTANQCWDALSTAYGTICQSTASNNPAGTVTTVKFRAQAGATAAQPAGSYTATVIFTAFAN